LNKVVFSVVIQCIAISFVVRLGNLNSAVAMLAHALSTAWRVGTVEK